MEYPIELTDLTKSEQLLSLTRILRFILDNLDEKPVTTTDPNGNLSGRKHQVILYNNAGTFSLKVNTTGLKVWQAL